MRAGMDDGLRAFHRCPDCHTTTGQHLHRCPSDPLAGELTPAEADRLRAEYEAQEREKAERKARERVQWDAAVRSAQRRVAERADEELAADVAWARTVLVEGETFPDGLALYCALHAVKKASVGRSLGYSEISRLRRVTAALMADRVAMTTEGVA